MIGEVMSLVASVNPGREVKQLVFVGEDFTKEAVLWLRDKRLK